jgi:2-keto-4-pentenoate hydratase
VVAAFEAQLERRGATLGGGATPVGWKLGFDIPELERLGAEPVVGHLTSATLLRSGTRYRADRAADLRAETELAVEIGQAGAIAGIAVALELVDVARPPDGLEGIVAGNVFHRAFVLGPVRAPRPTTGLAATLYVGGELRQSARLEGDPAEPLAAAGLLLEAVGERLRPGDRVLTGSVNHVPVAPGDEVAVQIEGLGRLELTVERPRG